jgi:hypothetical protein
MPIYSPSTLTTSLLNEYSASYITPYYNATMITAVYNCVSHSMVGDLFSASYDLTIDQHTVLGYTNYDKIVFTLTSSYSSSVEAPANVSASLDLQRALNFIGNNISKEESIIPDFPNPL